MVLRPCLYTTDIVDFSSSAMAFNVAKIASARASLPISLVDEIVTCGRAFSVVSQAEIIVL